VQVNQHLSIPVTVHGCPFFLSAPKTQVLIPGSTALFECTIVGSQTVRVKIYWVNNKCLNTSDIQECCPLGFVCSRIGSTKFQTNFFSTDNNIINFTVLLSLSSVAS